MTKQIQDTSTAPTCGEALVQLLEDYGIDTVFGIPGVHTLELYRGLPGTKIRHVLPRHEQGAGFMAAGYARASGKVGVCFLITGPGLTNAMTAIGEAYCDSVPLLVITSVNPRDSFGKGWGLLHEVTDQRAMTAPLTAFSATALVPEDVPHLLARAFSLFSSGRPRPVHIEIPLDVLAAPAPGPWKVQRFPGPPAPARADIIEAAALLKSAKRPLIIAGGGALGADEEIATLAKHLGANVITTNFAKGLVPESNPLSLGTSLWHQGTREVIKEADVVLALGTELAPTEAGLSFLEITGDLIRVDLDHRKINDHFNPRLGLVADAKQTAAALVAKLDGHNPGTRGDEAAARARRAKDMRAAEWTPLQRKHMAVMGAIDAAVPDEARFVCDMTQIVYTANHSYPRPLPRRWLYPVGFGTLGYAVPTAIGAMLACPEDPTLVLVGDHGLLYTATELAVAAELDLPLVVLLWNNDVLGQIRDDMVKRNIPPVGVYPKSPDHLKLAEALGLTAVRPANLAEVTSATKAALARPGPSLIEINDALPELAQFAP